MYEVSSLATVFVILMHMKQYAFLALHEFEVLKTLNDPRSIQTFLDSLSMNHEKEGETCMSPLRVLQTRKAHCIEGALLAAVCLMIHAQKPLILNLKVHTDDVDHIVTLFKRNGYYGAISKTNHGVLRYRDPVYKSVRELVMSYFHEYFLSSNGKKTLLGYTRPTNVRTYGLGWITREDDLWDIAEAIYDMPIIDVVPHKNKKYIREATAFERQVASIPEWV